MYRVLIVDDEKMIRMGMKNAIDWKKLGVDGVFTAASGNEALKILKEEGPEIMVTDIQMTEMTGLELIKAARESVPELRVIVLQALIILSMQERACGFRCRISS